MSDRKSYITLLPYDGVAKYSSDDPEHLAELALEHPDCEPGWECYVIEEKYVRRFRLVVTEVVDDS